jgi:GAF domain-containing protein
MRRRSKAGSASVKSRRRKAATPKRRSARAALRRSSSAASEQAKAARFARERDEAMVQLAAATEVLGVISNSSGELDLVFDTILRNATRICEATFGNLWLCEGDSFRIGATHGAPFAYREYLKSEPVVEPRAQSDAMARIASTRKPFQIEDLTKIPTLGSRMRMATIKLAKARTLVVVPMLKGNDLVGVIAIYRQEVRPFTDKQIELLQNFAAQAVIAIANARLLNELRQRTDDLTESLEQQTATSEILDIISNSPTDTQPAFDAIVRSGLRLFPDAAIMIGLLDGDVVRAAAIADADPAGAEALRARTPLPLTREFITSTAILDRREVDLPDVRKAPAELAAGARNFLASGYRAQTVVPMMRGESAIGTVNVVRRRPGPLSDKQRELLRIFANQAVIAIENTRLFNELRRRTDDLSESLEQQTATSEVLRVISSSPGDLQPVFSAMLESAARLCDASFGNIFRWDDDALRLVATYNTPAAFTEARSQLPLRRNQNNPIAEMLAAKTVLHVDDLAADERYTKRRDQNIVAAVKLGGVRTFLAVPMLKDNELIGALIVYRQEVRPFSDKQIELVKNFAAQAVIAIENTRLLNELRESLEQQTATSKVLEVISSSPGELQSVFQTMLENATRICGAKFSLLLLLEGNAYRYVALHGAPPPFVESCKRRQIISVNPGTAMGRAAATKKPVQFADIRAEPAYTNDPERFSILHDTGARTFLSVPMLKDNDVIGAINIYRQEVRPFSDKQIELVQNFAAQAVIAIENTRLLNELRESLDQQTATANILQVINESPGELAPVFDALLEKAMRLCTATFGHLATYDGEGFKTEAIRGLPAPFAEFRSQNHPSYGPGTGPARLLEGERIVHFIDAADTDVYRSGDLNHRAVVDLGGARTMLVVPLLKDQAVRGFITLYRQQVKPFNDKQIALVQNFAAQAVIAIENARLLNELRKRTSDLTESLEQQTATSKVLEVISRSAFDLQAVFETVVESSVRLCGAARALIYRFDGEVLRLVATFNAPKKLKDFLSQNPIRPGRYSTSARAALERRTVHIPDVLADAEHTYGTKNIEKLRTALAVPILKGEDLLGVLTIYHLEEVRPFTDKQIALVETFADQAAIAIDNVRLLDELRDRTDELGRSVSELTALGEVSQAVNSTLDLETVLSTIVAKAVQLSGTEAGAIYGYDEQAREFRLRATYGMDQGLIDALMQRHIGLDDPNVASALAQREPTQIADLRKEAPSELNDIILRAGYRARMIAPLMRGEEIVGTLVVRRRTPGEFAKNTVDLIKTFAAQSALAIQNARLFHEIEDKSRQLEEASQHKSQFLANMSHELRTPLNAILGYTELMADGAYGEPSEKMLGILKRLEANSRHLLGLINDVLDLSKIEAGQLVLELSDYSVQDIAQTVRSTLEPLAADKKLAFKLELGRDLPPGHGDGRRLTQVLINLVGNAIKFTDAGEVAIKAEAHNGSFHVSVRDTGPGISSADQARLFQEFQQADNAITKKKGGTGLGLAISKRIIQMHGGRIWVESQPGQGSTFTFTLPVIVEQQVEAA